MDLIREEQDAIGGQEFHLPGINPVEIWDETGRNTDFGDEMFRVRDRKGRTLALDTRLHKDLRWGGLQHRLAFGSPIIVFPAVQETIARMKVLQQAATAATLRIMHMGDLVATGQAPTSHGWMSWSLNVRPLSAVVSSRMPRWMLSPAPR